jgi:diadenosine tetraphosphate (Ap4A) HIT family hydrolase
MIAGYLFRLARSRSFSAVARFGFAHLSGWLPVHRIGETAQVLAFDHPRPSWQPHILFVPKAGIASLLNVRPEQVPLVRGLVQLALTTASEQGLAAHGFTLLVNGGAYQDVGQLHFHLAGQPCPVWYGTPEQTTASVLLETECLTAVHHLRPQRTTHLVLRPRPGGRAATPGQGFDATFIDAAITATQALVRTLGLLADGYSLIVNQRPGEAEPAPCFHLVSGDVLGDGAGEG